MRCATAARGFVCLVLLLTAAACGAQSKTPVDYQDRDGDGIPDKEDRNPNEGDDAKKAKAPKPLPPAPTPAADATDEEKREQQKQLEQQIVYSAKLTMAVFQVDQGLRAVESLARNMGGYLAQKHDREITIRVPRARFDPTLVAIDKVGDVIHRDVEAEDVTESYIDIDIRLTNARAMQTRLRLLLDKAAVKEALDIEKELARVTQEIELLEGKMKVLKDRIEYSTITVTFETRSASAVAARMKLPFPWINSLGLPTLLTLEEAK